ncbi:MAG: hypothetical protein KIT09_09090 [Bryobacteraceae bacterium]|nr:hypothetical protein [Bryobacteraceae bacterium]
MAAPVSRYVPGIASAFDVVPQMLVFCWATPPLTCHFDGATLVPSSTTVQWLFRPLLKSSLNSTVPPEVPVAPACVTWWLRPAIVIVACRGPDPLFACTE